MNKTNIEWCDYSWPIVNGCTRVSRGCEHCYAERLAGTRLRHHPKYAGLARQHVNGEPRWTGEVRPWPAALYEPFRLRKPSRIFVADMGDLFHEKVPDEFLLRVFATMAFASRHTFQILTKRAERMLDFCSDKRRRVAWTHALAEIASTIPGMRVNISHVADGREGWHLSNVWLGVSVEDQQRADERVPLLLQTPAALRFLSVEPLLGPVKLDDEWLYPRNDDENDAIAWVIVGGESGPGARPCDVAWIRSIVAQCEAAGIPAFVKQLGSDPVRDGIRERNRLWPVIHGKGGSIEEWPSDLRVRQFPEPTR